jgi:4'-phosphopantetheinyl transferase
MSGDQAKGVKVEAKMDRACSHDSSRCCADGQTKDLMNQTLPPLGLPPKTVIDVWRVELDQPPEIAATLDEILSAEERERANRFVFARDAARFRLGRAMLRLGLAWYLEQPPREIRLTTGWRGKPRLADPSELHFNVSHCGGLALIAFTTVGEVGVDVEALGRDVEAVDIATSNFTRNEAALIASAPNPEEQVLLFLRFWTRKEAVLKADGCGIFDGLDSVDVSQPAANLVRLREGDNIESGWLVRDLNMVDGFAGSIAAPPGDWSIRKWNIRCEDAIRCFVARFPVEL